MEEREKGVKNDSKWFLPQVLAAQFLGTQFLSETAQERGEERKRSSVQPRLQLQNWSFPHLPPRIC